MVPAARRSCVLADLSHDWESIVYVSASIAPQAAHVRHIRRCATNLAAAACPWQMSWLVAGREGRGARAGVRVVSRACALHTWPPRTSLASPAPHGGRGAGPGHVAADRGVQTAVAVPYSSWYPARTVSRYHSSE